MPLFLTRFQSIKSLNPAWLAFFASLVLSAIAIQFEVTVSRDAAYYLTAISQFNGQGLKAAFAQFDWPWFLLLISASHNLSGLALETLAYFWITLFMAVCCALLVDTVVRRVPNSSGWALLVVLAMPSFNQFRGDIIREHGFWCFSVLALWLALRWDERGGWRLAALMQLSVVLAALFRLDAVILMPALVLWRLLQVRQQNGWRRLLQASLLPALVAAAGAMALLMLGKQWLGRLSNYLYVINPQHLFAQFSAVSERFSGMLAKWSAADAGNILLFGFLLYILGIFIRLLGPFALPFLFPSGWGAFRLYWQRFQPFALAFVLYFLVLSVYFIYNLFMNARYASYLNLLAVPLAVIALTSIGGRFPRAAKGLAVLGLAVMLANVVSLSAGKSHYIEAAKWIKTQEIPDSEARSFYFEDGRIAYYAGWGYVHPDSMPSLKQALSDDNLKRFRYLVFEEKADAPWLLDWFKQHPEYKILAQFTNSTGRKGKTVLIIGDCGEKPVAGCKTMATTP